MEYLTEGTAQYEAAWDALRRRVGSLDGWQYMGPNSAYDSHVFRLRETATTPRRVELIRA